MSWPRLAQALAEAGYDTAGLRELLRIPEPSNAWRPAHASYLYRCQHEDSQRSRMAMFWFLGQPQPRDWLEAAVGSELVEVLVTSGFAQDLPGGQLRARIDVSPCLGRFFCHDSRMPDKLVSDRVYELGSDSYTLARLTPRKSGARALDLCTGSGVHAVLAAREHASVVGVDLNPRALEFSRINARMNGAEPRCSFVQGDLYAPVEGQRFDLITINPPFVSTPESMEIHRTGGESGEDISERAVAALPTFLSPGGTFSMVLSYPIVRDSTYLARLADWLKPGSGPRVPGWGIAVLLTGSIKAESYIGSHAISTYGSADPEVYERYLASYERLGIERIGYANVLIRRLPAGHPGFSVEHSVGFPHADRSAAVEAFLQAQERFADPQPLWRPRWNGDGGELWTTPGAMRVVARPGSLAVDLDLDEADAHLASLIDGQRTSEELRQLSPERADALLICLGRNLYVT